MLVSFIKYSFIITTTLYIYFQLLHINTAALRGKKIFCIIFLSISATIIGTFLPFYTITIYLFFYFVLLLLFHSEPKICFIASLIAFFLSYALLVISTLIYSTIFYPFFHNLSLPPDTITFTISGILMYFIAHLLFRIKKFQKGIKSLYNHNLIYFSITISGLTILILSIGQYIYPSISNSQLTLYSIFILLAAILLFFLWQRCIRQYYLTKLRNLELEALRQELAEKDAEINKLLANNEKQARTIHRDNKLIPAMLSAVTDYLDSADESGSHALYGRELSCRLKELADERAENLTVEDTPGSLPLLHRAAVDAMLSYMKKRAAQEHISFEVKIHPEFADRTTDSIAEADLSHLLSDLLENAIIAIKNAESRQILVHLGILYGVPAVEVSDSGSEFSPAIYQDLGLQKHSTHLGHGGS